MYVLVNHEGLFFEGLNGTLETNWCSNKARLFESKEEILEVIHKVKLHFDLDLDGVIKEVTLRKEDFYGYLWSNEKGCDLCGKTPSVVEPRLYYRFCKEHQNTSPEEFKK